MTVDEGLEIIVDSDDSTCTVEADRTHSGDIIVEDQEGKLFKIDESDIEWKAHIPDL